MGSIDGGARFRPLPLPFFPLWSGLGGANELGSIASVPLVGIGVAFDSDDLSASSGGCTDGEGSFLVDDDEDLDATSDGYLVRMSGDNLIMTIRLLPLAAVDMMPLLVVGFVVYCGWWADCQRQLRRVVKWRCRVSVVGRVYVLVVYVEWPGADGC